ncbi:MAG: SPOR domain-containing protein [Pseudomonadales bacterium]|nr:SPOR domain-containing protein [Pseudomonadales bacterium]
MELKLKRRVVGALLLTTAAVIVLPMLLDGSAEDRARINTSIPEAPKIALKRLTIQQVKDAMLEMEAESTQQLPIDILEEKLPLDELLTQLEVTPKIHSSVDPEVEFQLDQNNLPISWSLQLGSFHQKNNAIKLRQSLRDAQYQSYILKANAAEKEVFRVFVGPILSIKKMKEFAVDIESNFKMKGQILRYKIEDDADQLEG